MHNLSIYSSVYNLSAIGFDWKTTLSNWNAFLQGHGQVVIACNDPVGTDATYDDVVRFVAELKRDARNQTDYKVFKTAIPFENPLFDGLIKNEALKRCTNEFCSLMDIDEVYPLTSRFAWVSAMEILGKQPYDALLIPSLDLFHDDKHYKFPLGTKWYIHRNRPDIMRGRVAFAAREDGTTDITKSDTTEVCYPDGRLVTHTHLIDPRFPDAVKLQWMGQGAVCYVCHLGWLAKEQRLKQAAFWAPHWNARDGKETVKPLTEAEFDAIPYKPHGLPDWRLDA
jgi:hypothetical protein